MSIPSVTKSLSSAISLIVAGAFCTSVAYDWGFLNAIGMSFGMIPMSISDHTESTLIWLPTVIIGILGAFILHVFITRADRGITDEEKIDKSKYPKIAWFYYKGWIVLIRATSVIALILFLLFGYKRLDQLMFPVFILWVIFAEWVINHKATMNRLPKKTTLLALAAAASFTLLALDGRSAALDALDSNYNIAVVTFRNGNNPPSSYHVLRAFDRGILVSDINKNDIRFINYDLINDYSWKYRKTEFKGLLDGFGFHLVHPETR